MILCLTPNPAIDRTLVLPGFRPGVIYRAGSTVAAGGKGLNVARAIFRLGGRAACGGFLGGHSGALLADLAQQEGLPGRWTRIAGETRTCIILVDPETGESTVVNEPGPTVNAEDWEKFQAEVLPLAAEAGCICLSGSLPPGSPHGVLTRLVQALPVSAAPIWIDSSGPGLQEALVTGRAGIKVNGEEAGALLGMGVDDALQASLAAGRLRALGARAVVLTIGKQGAVMMDEDGQSWLAQPPEVKTVNTVGSGDAFLAGLVFAIETGLATAEALRRATAAGTANAIAYGGGRILYADYKALREAVNLTEIG
ncbi:MAG TPA: hexose kinase [Anaerolineales bacterium]